MALFYDTQPDLARWMPEGQAATTARLLTEMGLLKPWHLRVYRSRWFPSLVGWLDRVLEPGMIAHIGHRKRFVDDEVRAALATGAVQVLVLGCGLDTLAIRHAPRHPDVAFVELDLPRTIDPKRAATGRAGLGAPNLHQVGAELGTVPLAEVLAGVPAWRPGRRSVVVAEGLLMYLDEADVRALLDALAAQVGEGSTLVFSWLPHDEQGRFLVDAVTRRSLQAVGEPIRWGVRPEELAPLLRAHGWRLVEDPARVDLAARYPLGPERAAAGARATERLGVAERMG